MAATAGRKPCAPGERCRVQLPIRSSTLLLVALGLAMLAVGVWVEDREAVAVPLVVIGALVVIAAVIVETWQDIEEMSVTQSGVIFKRRPPPSAEQLTQAGLPEQAAEEIQKWMDALLEVLPGAIDERVNVAIARRQPPYTTRARRAAIEAWLASEAGKRSGLTYYGASGPEAEAGPGAAVPKREPPKAGPGAATPP